VTELPLLGGNAYTLLSANRECVADAQLDEGDPSGLGTRVLKQTFVDQVRRNRDKRWQSRRRGACWPTEPPHVLT